MVGQDEPERVAMGPFSVKLAPTPLPLEGAALDSLYVYIQETLVNFMKGQAQSGFEVLYFVMTDIGVQETEGNVSTLRIGEGAAAFDVIPPSGDNRNDEAVPQPQQIEAWMRTAIDTRLVGRLESTEFYYVQEARFVSLAEAPANVPNNALADETARGMIPGSSSSGNSRAETALRTSLILAGIAIVLLGALLVRSHRQRQRELAPSAVTLENSTSDASQPRELSMRNDMDIAVDSSSALPAAPLSPVRQSYANPNEEPSSPPRTSSRLDDARSLADSESSWTVATEMGDSAALHSVTTHPSQALVSTESFEHDRQVYLQKDMLTTTWSGNNAVSGPVLSESVLQPSHFTAKQGRRSWVDTDESPRPFIFASHDDTDVGEEVFLMPDEMGDELL